MDPALRHSNSHLNGEDDFKIKGAASRSRSHGRRTEAEPETCTICLEQITERAVAVPCNHLTFDFLCLVSWLQERATCPLCKADVATVEYDWRGPNDFKTYHVPRRDVNPGLSSRFGSHDSSWRSRGRPDGEPREGAVTRSDPALERRRQIHQRQLFSLRIGANPVSRHRDFTALDFAASPSLQSRARTFLRRELRVFGFLGTNAAPRGGNIEFLLEYVVAILRRHDIKAADSAAHNMLSDYLGSVSALLLLHELESWLRSPFSSLDEWDNWVQYRDQSPTRPK